MQSAPPLRVALAPPWIVTAVAPLIVTLGALRSMLVAAVSMIAPAVVTWTLAAPSPALSSIRAGSRVIFCWVVEVIVSVCGHLVELDLVSERRAEEAAWLTASVGARSGGRSIVFQSAPRT